MNMEVTWIQCVKRKTKSVTAIRSIEGIDTSTDVPRTWTKRDVEHNASDEGESWLRSDRDGFVGLKPALW